MRNQSVTVYAGSPARAVFKAVSAVVKITSPSLDSYAMYKRISNMTLEELSEYDIYLVKKNVGY